MSEATTAAPSRAAASAKLPLPAATSSTSWPADTAQASHERRGGRLEQPRQVGVVAQAPDLGLPLLQLRDVHGAEDRLPPVQEVAPGIWHWTARHPRIGMDVSSYSCSATWACCWTRSRRRR